MIQAIPLLSIYPEETIVQKDICTLKFIAALNTIARTWKQPQCPSAEVWIKMWYRCTVEYCWTVKRNEIVPLQRRGWTWRWSYRVKSEREKQLSPKTAYRWNLEKWYRRAYLQSRHRVTDTVNKLMVTRGGGMV